MAAEPLRVIGFAYSEISINDWLDHFNENGDISSKFKESIDDGQFEFIFLAAIGLKD
jgi:hypothetical protein